MTFKYSASTLSIQSINRRTSITVLQTGHCRFFEILPTIQLHAYEPQGQIMHVPNYLEKLTCDRINDHTS